MNWLIMLLAAIFVPVVQPVVQQGMQNAQVRFAQRMQQQVVKPVQPTVVFHNGRWWKYEYGQWLVWQESR